MDIEAKAEKWADEHTCCDNEWRIAVAAYLAGSAQPQTDYTRSGPLTVRFHSEDGCPGHIVSEQSCPRCVCTCGARL